MPNPFFYGGRVEPGSFIGRKEVLRDIFNCLETAHTGQMQSVSVVGPHRMGRSSLLCYIAGRYALHLKTPAAYRIAYISLHDAECQTPGELLRKILKELRINLKSGKNVSASEFQQTLAQLKKQNIHPVVCLDEFEELIQTSAFNNDFFDSWRFLMSDSVIAFVIASAQPLYKLVAPGKYTSSFFNIFTVVELGEFTPEDVEQLIQRGRVCDRPFTDEDVKHMRLLGGRHPYKLQVAGAKIYLAKGEARMDWRKVKESVESQMKQGGLEKQATWLRTIWQGLLGFLCSIGRAVLELRKGKDEISDTTALWWGIIVILIALFLLLGWIPISWLFKLGSHWLGG
jgi:hypothetical protein